MELVSSAPFVHDRAAVQRAIEWADAMHSKQRRDVDSAPFIVHPLEVASLLSGRDCDDAVIIAGVLHDVVEKTDATVDDIRARFGDQVSAIVAALTEDDSIEDFGERKAALRESVAAAGPDALAVYAADKIAKARELRAQAARQPAWRDDPTLTRKLAHYEQSLAMLRDSGAIAPYSDQLAFELWALRVLPPG